MKRFMFLFLVVAFVAVMAGGAMAVDEGTDCVCPDDCNDQAVLFIDYEVKNLCCIDLLTDHVVLTGEIGCGCPGDWACFLFRVWASGNHKKIMGKLTAADFSETLTDAEKPYILVFMKPPRDTDVTDADIDWGSWGVKLIPNGPEEVLTRVECDTPICGKKGYGAIKLKVPSASKPHEGNAQLLFTIMDA